MVSIRVIALTAWLLFMLNISFVFGAPPRSEVDPAARKRLEKYLSDSRIKMYRNQYLYFCVVWQHFRQYFDGEEENSQVLNFLEDLKLKPSLGKERVNLATLRDNLRDWIPEYKLGVPRCPDIKFYIEENLEFSGDLARFLQVDGSVPYSVLTDALMQDYELYRQTNVQDRRRLVGSTPKGGLSWTVFGQLARARFLKTVLSTFNAMVACQNALPKELAARRQANPVVAATVAVGAAVPAAIPQAQACPNSPPRVPSPRLVPQIAPNPRPPNNGPAGLDLLAEAALRQRQQVPDVRQNVQVQQQDNQVQPVAGPVRRNRRRNRRKNRQRVGGQPRQRGGPPRRGHGHQRRRNGPRQRPHPQRPANPEGYRPQP